MAAPLARPGPAREGTPGPGRTAGLGLYDGPVSPRKPTSPGEPSRGRRGAGGRETQRRDGLEPARGGRPRPEWFDMFTEG